MIWLSVSICFFVTMVVACVQIVTRAGYSPWWVLFPLSLPVLWIAGISVAFHGIDRRLGTYGAFDVQDVAGSARLIGYLFVADLLANLALLLVFAFSQWPLVRRPAPVSSNTGSSDAEPSAAEPSVSVSVPPSVPARPPSGGTGRHD
jgi:hypothetical protein